MYQRNSSTSFSENEINYDVQLMKRALIFVSPYKIIISNFPELSSIVLMKFKG